MQACRERRIKLLDQIEQERMCQVSHRPGNGRFLTGTQFEKDRIQHVCFHWRSLQKESCSLVINTRGAFLTYTLTMILHLGSEGRTFSTPSSSRVSLCRMRLVSSLSCETLFLGRGRLDFFPP